MNNKTLRKTDIDAICSTMSTKYLKIAQEYKSSLDKQNISQTLQIEIKNLLEDARSILDYTAHDIANTHEIKAVNTYFPITKNFEDFEKRMKGYLPNLKSKNPTLLNYLESVQPYHQNYNWLGDFATIVNENKHCRLTPQKKIEIPSLTVEQNGAQIQVSGGASILIGSRAYIKLGNTTIAGNQKISPESEQIIYLNQKPYIKKERWVDFKFNGTISALPLIKKIQSKLPVIIEKIYDILQNTNFNN